MLSVTRAIKICGFMDREERIDPFYMERGTAIHEECKLIARRDPTAKTSLFFDLIAPHIESFEKWVELEKPEFVETEFEVKNEPMGYIGHLDALVRMKGELWILDYKAGGEEIWHPRQTALYALAWCANNGLMPTPKRGGLYLKKDGGLPKLVEHKDRRDFDRAKSIITVAYDLIENRKETA
jgi:PD-(D/E)XK nuclease superfamily protein